jgi:hypothetical protein
MADRAVLDQTRKTPSTLARARRPVPKMIATIATAV